jgi:hypothetical protein
MTLVVRGVEVLTVPAPISGQLSVLGSAQAGIDYLRWEEVVGTNAAWAGLLGQISCVLASAWCTLLATKVLIPASEAQHTSIRGISIGAQPWIANEHAEALIW